jgi:hypothetical protein
MRTGTGGGGVYPNFTEYRDGLRNDRYLSIFNKKLGAVSFDSRRLLAEMS